MQQRDETQPPVRRAQAGGVDEIDAAGNPKPANGAGSKREVLLDEFADRYERLMSVLCDAAKNGCAPRLELEYVDIRRWLLDRSTSLPTPFGATVRLSRGGNALGTTEDPIEQIVRPATLADLLATDSGELIERVSKVSEAVFQHYTTSRAHGQPVGD